MNFIQNWATIQNYHIFYGQPQLNTDRYMNSLLNPSITCTLINAKQQ